MFFIFLHCAPLTHADTPVRQNWKLLCDIYGVGGVIGEIITGEEFYDKHGRCTKLVEGTGSPHTHDTYLLY